MPTYPTIERLKSAIEHLQQFESKWVLIPLVFAVNGVDEDLEVDTNAPDAAGRGTFLDTYFHGSRIGLPPFANGVNTLRPRFREIYGPMKSSGLQDDYVAHQKAKLWANTYSSRGY